jgi:hypothetical protein
MRGELPRNALHLLVLSSFAFAQPLFDLLGKTPEFFVVRGSRPADIVVFAIVLTLVPPLVLVGVEAHAVGGLRLAFVDRLADPGHPQVLDEIHEELVARGLHKRDVKLPVGLEAGPHVGDRPALRRHRGPHPRLRGGQRALGGQARGARFDDQASLVRRAHAAARHVGHPRAAVGAHLDQAFGGEATQGLAHRGTGNSELAGQILLVHAGAAGQPAVADPLPDGDIDLVDHALDLQARHARVSLRLAGHRG